MSQQTGPAERAGARPMLARSYFGALGERLNAVTADPAIALSIASPPAVGPASLGQYH
jgi:hypothetical protein